MRRPHPIHRHLTLPLVLGLHISPVWAQNAAPDAGSLRQQIEQQRDLQPALPPPVKPPRDAPAPELQPQPGMSVTVKAFTFAGNTLVDSKQLAEAVSAFLNRPLSFEELRRATDAVAAVHREAGWIVRVYLPEQDVSEGTVLLQVVQARYGGLRFEGALAKHVQSAELQAHAEAGQVRGEPIKARALDRALLLADDLPGVSVAGTLAAGDEDGETVLVLRTTNELFIQGDVSLDNNGARSTGSERLSANLSINSPGGRGELVSLSALHTRGSDYGRISITVPVGTDGLRMGLNGSSLHYKLVKGSNAQVSDLKVKGSSGSLGLDLNYPLVRSRTKNLYLSGGLETKSFYNEDINKNIEDPKSYSEYETDSLRLGLSGNSYDEFGVGGANTASLQLLWGRLSMMTAHKQFDTLDRSYRKLSYSLSRLQTLTAQHSLYLSLSGQQTGQVLDSSERYYIGGPTSVRAYPASELGGDSGQLLNAEWRWRLSSALLLTGFLDVGRVVSLPLGIGGDPGDVKTSLILRGQGLSLGWNGPQGLSTRLIWSRRIGAHPRPTLAGTDSDGTLHKNRVWVNASLPF
jgi:hemolysin activation/secretion protein